jgi:hypothetical protein
LTVPTSVGPNAVSLKALGILERTSFARQLVLDDAVQLLEHVLVALEDVYDDSRIPNSSVASVLDDILRTSDHTIFVKIMTSVTKN